MDNPCPINRSISRAVLPTSDPFRLTTDRSTRTMRQAMLLPLIIGLVLLSPATPEGFTRYPLASGQAGQGRSCGTVAPDPTRMAEIETTYEKFQQSRGTKKSAGTITIPVYFHVINKGPGIDNGDVP